MVDEIRYFGNYKTLSVTASGNTMGYGIVYAK